MQEDNYCGVSFWHPKWLQKYANTKWFLGVYGLLGTIQAMSYMYFVVTLTTIEKRFHMPSQTTGIVLSGNEISQILLSLILSYAGGQRNRPLWIAWGMVFCGLSCFVLASPHFIYGLGEEAYQLTQEYADSLGGYKNVSLMNSSSISATTHSSHPLCKAVKKVEECNNLVTIVPLVLIFLSQFILGIGNTLYYSLGQTYLDDNTKKTNTPLMLAYAMTLRMIGPIIGFFLGYVSLNMYVDPTKTPLIQNDDPRWLGAWWFGWILLGTAMLMFSGLIGIFPKKLPKRPRVYDSGVPKALQSEEMYQLNQTPILDTPMDEKKQDFPKLKDFPKALARLLKNKLIMFNNMSGVFYILGASGYMTFMARYMEVQFHKTAQNATIVIGPLTISGMVSGLLISGWFISKRKPSASKVLFWNVLIGFVFMLGQFSYLFFYCGDTRSMMQNGTFNLTSNCNQNCHCSGIAYSPVCHEPTGQTFFSPCHAGCNTWNQKKNTYSNCSCSHQPTTTFTPQTTLPQSFSPTSDSPEMVILSTLSTITSKLTSDASTTIPQYFSDILNTGACMKGCAYAFYAFSLLSMFINWVGASGRIGNILVNYRAVATEDKSFAQGLTLMMISMFALIPGPIIFGRVIDNTCLVWNYQCGKRGDCQLYDQTSFRYYVNTLALSLTIFGVIFDFLVWFYGRNLDLYGENDEMNKVQQEMQVKNKVITPLVQRK